MSKLLKTLHNARDNWQAVVYPTISFPIATYNRFDIVFNRTIPSILDQGYKHIEIVVIGDAATDSRYHLISQIDPRVRFLNLSNRTKYPINPFDLWCVAGYRPRNIAARLCIGQWHWWISDDDVLEPSAVNTLVEFLHHNCEIESIYGDFKFYYDESNFSLCTLKNIKPALPFPITGMPSWVNRSYISRIFRWNGHSYLNSINKPSDYDLQQRMWEHGVKYGYINSCLASVRTSQKHGYMHGSKLYINHADVYQ